MRARGVLSAALLAVPLAGLTLLLAVPELDVEWQHQPSHFLLVLSVALVNVGLGLATSEASKRRDDPRLFLVSLSLLSSAGFLALHALATPGVVLQEPNAGFVIATPVGLVLASGFAAASALDLDAGGDRMPRWPRAARAAVAVLLVAWAIASLAGFPLLDRQPPDEVPLPVRLATPVAIALYGFAASRYAMLYRERHRPLPLAVAAAFVLLAEAMVAVAFGRAWRASWWEWHVLMAIAFGTITWAARAEYRSQGSLTAAFGGLYLQRTLETIDRRSSDALAAVARAVQSGDPLWPILDRLRTEGFSADELTLLERSGRELAAVDELFGPYVGPRLAERLRNDPELAGLGGREADVTVLFADLAGFTTFSERRSPPEVIEMLNTYWRAAVPVVAEREGGVIERFAGDAVLVVFNALDDQPDHAERAARAALAMRAATEAIASDHPGWPRFRIGLNTGPAAIGNVGAGGQRSFTAIGDTTNVAARLQAAARPGQVVVGPETYRRIAGRITARPVGPLSLKGKSEPVQAFALGEPS